MKFSIEVRSKDGVNSHEVAGNRCVIGSSALSAVVLAGWKIQKQHAELFISNEQIFIRDLGSMFGTIVDGVKIDTVGPLNADHQIAIGQYQVSVSWARSEQTSASTAASHPNAQSDEVERQIKRKIEELQVLQSSAVQTVDAIEAMDEGRQAPQESGRLIDSRSSQAVAGGLKKAVLQGRANDRVKGQSATPARAVQPQAAEAEPLQEAFSKTGLVDESRLALRRSLQDKLIASFDLRRIDIHKMSDEKLRAQAQTALEEILKLEVLPPEVDRDELIREVRDEAIGLGLLEPLLADPTVTEIMVNTFDEIFVERKGVLSRVPLAFSSEKSVMGIIERVVAPVGRRIDESSPLVDARLKDGSRFNAIIPPLALKGPSMTIRKFATKKLGGEDLITFGSASEDMVKFLRIAVQYKKNTIVSGGTGSGKTTLLNILSNFIPHGERIVTIEDAAELRINHEHLVSLEARPPNAEGKGAVTIRDLVKNSLRMRPDRIVVGECRGGEALDMLQAMNTGHDGSLTTAHANTPRDMLARLEIMVLMSGMDLPVAAIREQVASAIDIVVQQTRYVCGSRKISKICEVTGVESGKIQLQELFEFVETGFGADGKVQGYFTGCGAIPEFYERMQASGMKLDIDIFRKAK